MTASSYPLPTPVRESGRRMLIVYSTRSSRQNPTAWGWVYRFAVQSSRPIMVGYGLPRTNSEAPYFSFPCPQVIRFPQVLDAKEEGEAQLRRSHPAFTANCQRGCASVGPAHRQPVAKKALRLTLALHGLPARRNVRAHLVGNSVKTESRFWAAVWHALPHLASFPCGGLSFKVAGVKLLDAASYRK